MGEGGGRGRELILQQSYTRLIYILGVILEGWGGVGGGEQSKYCVTDAAFSYCYMYSL